MRLNVPDNQAIAVVSGAALCPALDGWRGLYELCRSGQRALREMELPEPRSRAEVRQRRMMSRSAVLAAWTVREALEDDECDRRSVGLFMGVGSSQGSMQTLGAMLEPSMDDGTFCEQRFGGEGLGAGNPLFAFQLMNNYTMCHAAILEGLGGANNAFFSQGSGTVVALIEAAYALLEGDAVRVLAGAADSAHHPVTAGEIERLGLVDQGFAPSEGAAVVAMESVGDGVDERARLEHAAIYNARGCDTVEVLARAITAAGACELVVLAPWGTPARDAMHRAIRQTDFGGASLDVTATLGDALAATPALGWLVAIDALEQAAYASALVLGLGIDGDVTAVAFKTPDIAAGAIDER